MAELSKDLREYFGGDIATIKGESLDLNGCVLKARGLTEIDLAYKYDKEITARVGGEWVGWGSVIGFINYYANSGRHKKDITDVAYWGNVGCKYHLQLQYCLQGKDAEDLLTGERDDEIFPTKTDKNRYLGTYCGKKLPRVGRPLEIKYKSLYDEKGFLNYKI
tara:strand:- start:543 stop:1031 length:489 start_codon:yes stop_codon:yes gene_type:complete